jgi:hypothetical protein
MNKLLPVLAATLAFQNVFAHSESNPSGTPTVEKFLANCKADDDDPHRAYCVGYLTGVAQEMEVIGAFAIGVLRYQHGMCIAESHGPTGRALADAFIKWAEKNPKALSVHYQIGVPMAFADTWPCPEK